MENTEIYKGIEIEIWHDEHNENPFENWDGCVPLMVESGRSYKEDYSKGEIDEYLMGFLSYNQFKRHQRRILSLIDYDLDEFRNDYPTDEYDRTDMLMENFEEWLMYSFENRASFCEEFGVKHLLTNSTGYSQGAWAELFMCWTPEFKKVTGRTYESMDKDTFEEGAKLWGYWAWGDVYGFTIPELDGSCGGFYGDDYEKNGLMEMARAEIDAYLVRIKKQRQSKLKKLIVNQVPLNLRAQIIG